MSVMTQAVAAPREEQPIDLSPFPVYRFSVEQYQRMVDVGILTEDDRVELLEGWIVPKMVHGANHDSTVDEDADAIRDRLPDEWRVRDQKAVALSDSQPEPDLAVVRGPATRYRKQHPTPAEIGILVEIAESSLDRDRRKARIYAREEIPVYWIVNLIDSQVEVYSDPTGPTSDPHYRQEQIYKPGESVPLMIDGDEVAQIPVSDLLP